MGIFPSRKDEPDLFKVVEVFWKESSSIVQASRGASKGLGVLMSNKYVSLMEETKTKFWVLALLEVRELGEQIPFVNTYAPILYSEIRILDLLGSPKGHEYSSE